ncbi:MAG TPA: hypothetical protein VGK54_16035, partial [Chloroflexota bacterium]
TPHKSVMPMRRVPLVLILGAFALISCSEPGLSNVAPPGATANQVPAVGPAVPPGGKPATTIVPCENSEQVTFHIHAHLAIYHDGTAVQVPHGIGIGEPQRLQSTPDGPFVTGGSCFSWLHTHTDDGVIHIEAPEPRVFTLGDFFGVWGQPLSNSQVGSLQGPVAAYVNGDRFTGDVTEIPLSLHAVIQLNVGSDSPPPQPYTFANGL